MGKLRELAEGLEGEALVEALANFEYAPDEYPITAAKGTLDWYSQIDAKPLGGSVDSWDDLMTMLHDGTIDIEVYGEVLRRRSSAGGGKPPTAGKPEAATPLSRDGTAASPAWPFRTPIMDGAEALSRLAGDSGVVQLLADHAVFLHPDTVRQTGGDAVFPVIRKFAMRGREDMVDGQRVLCCDNDTPTRAFLWSAGRGRGTDVQFNHLWTASSDPRMYTALWNLCATPAFLAKLTDGKRHPETVAAIQYRAYQLYGYSPGEPPTPPAGYSDLSWSEPLEPVGDLEGVLRQRLKENPRSRAALAARTIGWLFSHGQPDPTVGVEPAEL